MTYNHEPIVRQYQAMDANLAVEKELVKLPWEKFGAVPGSYQLTQSSSCLYKIWQCQCHILVFPRSAPDRKPADVTSIIKMFDEKWIPWSKKHESWEPEDKSNCSLISKIFTVFPDGWSGGEIRTTVTIVVDEKREED